MDEGLREEEKVGKIMTLKKNNEFTGHSENVIRIKPHSLNMNSTEITSERDVLTCFYPENTDPLRTELLLADRTGQVNTNEVEQPTANGYKDLIKDVLTGTDSYEDRDVKISSIVVDSGAEATESHPEISSLNADIPLLDLAKQGDSEYKTLSAWQPLSDDEEIARKAKDDGHVDVVFPGTVTQDSCCRFVSELLKCVLYQRQQLPMTYDQLVFFQKQQQHTSMQPEDTVVRKSMKTSTGLNVRHCQRTLQEVDEVLSNLEALFSLSHVPRILFLLGGSALLPVEVYEINMESLVVRGGDTSLRTSSCLRLLFRTLFVADLLSDVKPVRLMATTVMALGHRDCGISWFKPKVDFRIPKRIKKKVISLGCATSVSGQAKAATRDWEDYIWFQAPVAIKGFCK